MIKNLLIANRGEIACRIMRTARRMGIVTTAVFSEADENALHVRSADYARCIGPASAAQSYLNIPSILQAAKKSGADAIHPGYGFLAENAEFAEAVRDAGLIFVGPPAAAIRAMGAKDNAKSLMAEAGVPIVPGYYGADQSLARMQAEARAIGFPVLIKAALGGGGKGMRIVGSEAELVTALESAGREAQAAFGDGRLLLERYLANSRHVEVQIFADRQGEVVHLFERDCSLQRRHQKIIEEAPAPGMTSPLRQQMTTAAIAAAKAVAYEGAGTIEFLLAADQQFYFMEMNTRLQVEHPVSEAVTGQDFVEWQLRIADGEPLPLQQSDITLCGHAVEARLYAEDPDNAFMPAPGLIQHLEWPTENAGLRIDTGVAAGDRVSPHYDPMIAKIIGFGESREAAIDTLATGLNRVEIVGPGQNLRFLLHLLNSAAFRAGAASTTFVDDLAADAFALTDADMRNALGVAARFWLAAQDRRQALAGKASQDPYSPWGDTTGWRLQGHQRRHCRLILGDRFYDAFGHWGADGYTIEIGDHTMPPEALPASHAIELGGMIHVFGCGGPVVLGIFDPLEAAADAGRSGNPFAAPMPGKISAVHVKPGDRVKAGQVLVVLEAMKMEHAIVAPMDGVVVELFVTADAQVDEGIDLLAMEPDQ